ncbi:MAG: ribonuclease Z [Prevotella sp.]|uniref:ribonuclease Z n=1 Tax=Prevotella sp. TaxID=59823 RepID=UPI002A337421|nr:ribonuclease Z [Prevotella sp.]MDD7318296.1 ribonuclease Z [Prevotellaceae bacterium]MDY4019700.1 ribonuclease Z [Prevotella sp.]
MTPFKLHILGCGSALPTTRHYASSQIVELRGKLFMVDCGEGTQIQLRRARIGFNKIRAVFISHLHGDHCFGLIGMISTFGLQGRTAPLHVYAPKELEKILTPQLQLFCTHLSYDVHFHEVNASEQNIVYEDDSLSVETIPLEHRIPCCGYLFREKPTLPHIRRDMIDYLGIPISRINNIKHGADWVKEDGTVVPNNLLVSPPQPPRAYAYCSDTRYIPTLHERLKDVDLLYHESTYGDDNLQMAEKYNHSTARQAAFVARDAGVKRLLLGHYSSRYDDEEILLRQAKEVFPNTMLANEKMVIDI